MQSEEREEWNYYLVKKKKKVLNKQLLKIILMTIYLKSGQEPDVLNILK